MKWLGRIGLACWLLQVPASAATKANELDKTKKQANQTLDQFAEGLQQTLHGAKKRGDTFLQKIDDAVHQLLQKLTRPSKTTGHP